MFLWRGEEGDERGGGGRSGEGLVRERGGGRGVCDGCSCGDVEVLGRGVRQCYLIEGWGTMVVLYTCLWVWSVRTPTDIAYIGRGCGFY